MTVFSSLEVRSLDQQQVTRHIEVLSRVTADLPDDGWSREKFLLELPGKWALSFALWSDSGPVAYAILSRKGPDTIHLHRLMIAAAWRRRGLGHRILEEIRRRARRDGAVYCTLKVEKENPDAQRFYRRHGFEPVGQVRAYIEMRTALRPAKGDAPT